MKIIISNCIEIQNGTQEIKDFCKKELTYKNPQYQKMRNMNFYIGGMQKEIRLYSEYNNSLYLPIGFFNKLYNHHPVASDYVDYSISKKVNIESNIKLRDYQELAVPAVEKYFNGLIIMPCGLR